MNLNILLVQPLGKLSQPSGYMRTCNLEPISLEYLASSINSMGYTTEIMSGEISEKELFDWIKNNRPSVVGFSVHSYVYENSLCLARTVKKAAEEMDYEIMTVFGGPHPTALPNEVVLHPAVDFVVVGEGESVFVELLRIISIKGNFSSLPGIVFKEAGEIISTGRAKRIEYLDKIPWPTRNENVLDVARQYQIAYPPPGQQMRIAQVMYSRGCPFSCSFCSSESTWGRQVFWRKPQSVLDEIEYLVKEYHTNLVYFPDLTFNVDRKKVICLCEEFNRRRPPVHWWALFRADLLDKELLCKLRNAGCVKISLGLESPNLNIARNLKGAYEAQQSQIREKLIEADRLGFIIKAFLIIGFPEETPEAINTYKDQLHDYPIDELRVTFATPFPGTKFFNECIEKQLIDKEPDWSKFTTDIPVLRHPKMSDDEIINLREELVTGFYFDPNYIQHVGEKLQKFPYLRNSWVEYFEFLQEKGVFKRKQKELFNLMETLKAINIESKSHIEALSVNTELVKEY